MEASYERKFRVWIIEDENTNDVITRFEEQYGQGSIDIFCTASYNESVKFAEFLNHFILTEKRREFERFIPDFVIIDLMLPEINDDEQESFIDDNKEYLTPDVYTKYYQDFNVTRDIISKPTFSNEYNKFTDGGFHAHSSLSPDLDCIKEYKIVILSGHQGLLNTYIPLVKRKILVGCVSKSGVLRNVEGTVENDDQKTVFYKSFIDFRSREINKLDFIEFNRFLRGCQSAECLNELKEWKIYSKDGQYYFLAKNLFAYEFKKYQDFEALIEKIAHLIPPANLSTEFSTAYNNDIIRLFSHAGLKKEYIKHDNKNLRVENLDKMKNALERLKKRLESVNLPNLKCELYKLDNLINTIKGKPPTLKVKDELYNCYKKLRDQIKDYIIDGDNEGYHYFPALENIRKLGLKDGITEIDCALEGISIENIDECCVGRNQIKGPEKGFKYLKDYLHDVCGPLENFYGDDAKIPILHELSDINTEIFFDFYWIFRNSIKNMLHRNTKIGKAKKNFLLYRAFIDETTKPKIQENYICFLSDGSPFPPEKIRDNDTSDGFKKDNLNYFGDLFIFNHQDNGKWEGQSIFSDSPDRKKECQTIAHEILDKIDRSREQALQGTGLTKAFVFKFNCLLEVKL